MIVGGQFILLLWQITLSAFIITSAFGLYIFSSYTFRVKLRYPLLLVSVHVLAALTTTVLFAILIVRIADASIRVPGFAKLFSSIAFALVVLTVASGLYFYFRYDARRRRTPWKVIITHLMLAGLSFIFAISSISTVAQPPHVNHYAGSAWYKYNLRHDVSN